MSAALTLLLAATLLVAGAAKLRDRSALTAVLRRTLPPGAPVRPLAAAIPAIELALGALLLVTGSSVPAAAAAVLLVAFSVALRFAAARAPVALAACRCFGAASDAPPAQALARNALLVAAAVAVVVEPPGALWHVGATELAGAATVAVGAACLWTLATLAWRMRPGALA